MPNKQQTALFLQRHKKRGAKALSILGQNQRFVDAIETPVGQEILADMVEMMDLKLAMIIEREARPEDKADCLAYKRMVERYAEKIAIYYDLLNEVNSVKP